MELQTLIDHVTDAIGVINTNSTPAQRLVGGGVVVDSRGRLLVLFSDFAYQGWHFPKGGLDEGENSLQGAIREVFEESGGVRTKPFSGDIKFQLQPGRVYREPIGFGSSRAEEPEHRTSEKISQGVSILLDDAAKEAMIDPELMIKHRYAIFDALVKKNIEVAWVTVPTYHMLVYQTGTHQPTWESVAVEWHTMDEIPNLRAPDKPNAKPRMGGATKTILNWAGIRDIVEAARKEANEAKE